jgi:Icc-related predicted phosphoesterase
VNSARPNPWPWRSNGEIPPEQLEALKDILKDERLKERFLFVITHYAPRLANGENDRKLHGLINADTFLETCAQIETGAVLFGHIHRTYRLQIPKIKSEFFCAGSATMEGHEGLWVYELNGKALEAKQVGWNGKAYAYL